MFSSTAEYALRAVAHLAIHPQHLDNSKTIAENTRVPQGYLSKILKNLVEAGIIESQRGPNGGFALARPPESITILEVMNAVDPLQRIKTCPLGIPSHGTRLCKLHRRLDDAIALVENALGNSTIADMVERPNRSENCSFPLEHRAFTSATVKGRKPRI